MSERTKQVQFRMPVELHKKLKIALIENDSSLADFFNYAAEDYLKNLKINSVYQQCSTNNGRVEAQNE